MIADRIPAHIAAMLTEFLADLPDNASRLVIAIDEDSDVDPRMQIAEQLDAFDSDAAKHARKCTKCAAARTEAIESIHANFLTEVKERAEHKAKPDPDQREPIGYVAFVSVGGEETLIASSFRETRAGTAGYLEESGNNPVLAAMIEIGLMTRPNIKPVFL